MKKFISLIIYFLVCSASAKTAPTNPFETLFTSADRVSRDQGLQYVPGGQFTITNTGTLRFFETYFYSDSSCSSLISYGVASIVRTSTGMALDNTKRYIFDGSLLYSLAANRVIDPNSIQCIQVYMDGGNESGNGLSCMSYTDMSCTGTGQGGIGSCSSSQSKSGTWGASPTLCVTPRYAYLLSSNSSNTQIQKCTVESSGLLDNCTTTGPSLALGSLGNIFNNGYGYFSNRTSSTANIRSCSVDPNASGALATDSTPPPFAACITNTIADWPSGYSPKGIAINGPYSYVVSGIASSNASGQIDRCAINLNGSLSSCTAVVAAGSSSGLSDPRGIAINNGYIYITNDAPGALNNTVNICTLTSDGLSVSCPASPTNPSGLASAPKAITTYNNYLYFVNSASDGTHAQVVYCPINGDGTLGTCGYTGPSAASGYQGITISVVNGTAYAYVVNNTPGVNPTTAVQKCTVGSDGTLSSCTATGPSTTNLVSISIY